MTQRGNLPPNPCAIDASGVAHASCCIHNPSPEPGSNQNTEQGISAFSNFASPRLFGMIRGTRRFGLVRFRLHGFFASESSVSLFFQSLSSLISLVSSLPFSHALSVCVLPPPPPLPGYLSCPLLPHSLSLCSSLSVALSLSPGSSATSRGAERFLVVSINTARVTRSQNQSLLSLLCSQHSARGATRASQQTRPSPVQCYARPNRLWSRVWCGTALGSHDAWREGPKPLTQCVTRVITAVSTSASWLR